MRRVRRWTESLLCEFRRAKPLYPFLVRQAFVFFVLAERTKDPEQRRIGLQSFVLYIMIFSLLDPGIRTPLNV